ncbi:hypothetical protein, partial [Bradyrhizobium sp.]|uniref:hypothetical protein n=1 Tax=Bradyrhizobium sp. TaxID=376 RepID=UPI003C3F462A
IVGGDVLDDRERVGPGINYAFEEGHAVSTLPFSKFGYERYARRTPTCARIRAVAAARPDDPTHRDQGLPGRSDVICGIGATGGRVHPQAMLKSSTALRAR